MGNKGKDTIELLVSTPSSDGATKYLWRLSDGQNIEGVILKHENMTCACISSQVGCLLDCVFCATARLGFIRNLTPEEITDQVKSINNEFKKLEGSGASLSRILFMGMGEPFLNYEPVVESAKLIRKRLVPNFTEVFLATSGVIPQKIYELAYNAPFIRLWVSLCAVEDVLRARIMPAASSTSIEILLDASEAYAKLTGYPVRVNYIMIDGVSDSFASAEKLIRLLKGKPFELQLSMLNPIPESTLRSSSPETIHQFAEFIDSHGVSTTIFESKGTSIIAACGQLSASIRRKA